MTDFAPPRRLRLPIDGSWGSGEMAVLEFGDPGRPVDMIFAHANGFNALTYRSLLAPLAEGRRIWAPDLRGHGATTLPIGHQRRGWRDHAADLLGLIDAADGPPIVLAGHSMGATASLLATAERPERVRGLVLLDPVIWRRAAVLAFNLPVLDQAARRAPIVVNTLKRRSVFPDRAAALKAYAGRGAFKGWPEAVLADYLADGLRETPQGFVLACDPAWEASNYAAQAHDPWRALGRYRGPIHILKGQTGSMTRLSAGTPPGLPHVTVAEVEDGDHFFPMLKPQAAIEALRPGLG